MLSAGSVAFVSGAGAAIGSSVVKVPLAVCIRSVQAGAYPNAFAAAKSIVNSAGVRCLFTVSSCPCAMYPLALKRKAFGFSKECALAHVQPVNKNCAFNVVNVVRRAAVKCLQGSCRDSCRLCWRMCRTWQSSLQSTKACAPCISAYSGGDRCPLTLILAELHHIRQAYRSSCVDIVLTVFLYTHVQVCFGNDRGAHHLLSQNAQNAQSPELFWDAAGDGVGRPHCRRHSRRSSSSSYHTAGCCQDGVQSHCRLHNTLISSAQLAHGHLRSTQEDTNERVSAPCFLLTVLVH